MMSSVTFVATRRNGRALCFGGFYYHINKSVEERSYWKCRTKGCKSTIVTIKDIISSASGQHFHDPNESRVVVSDDCLRNGVTKISVTDSAIISNNSNNNNNNSVNVNKKQKTHSNSNNLVKKHKPNNYYDNNDEFDSLARHLNVEFEVDECGKVKLEDNDDNNSGSDLITAESSAEQQNSMQSMPYVIKPNNIYFTNNYSNIEHFDIELNNLFKVVRQSGFDHCLDIDQLSNDWELWKKRYDELKKLKKGRSQSQTNHTFGSNDKELENLKLQLELATNAKIMAERENKRIHRSYNEQQNTVSSLRSVMRKNLSNGANNQCVALLNEINELKRKVCSKVESYQSNLNEVRGLLCPDEDELRTEFEQLAQERDEALRENHELKQELEILRNKVSSNDDNSS